MDSTRCDRITGSLAHPQTRRGVLRLLGMAAVGGSGLSLLATREGAAKKKRAKKHAKGKTCTPGKKFATVTVPASGAVATTPVLKAGQTYRLRASGFWVTNPTAGNDAAAAFRFATPNIPVPVNGAGVRVGLAVDAGSPDLWGAYNTGHVYERTVAGANAALSLRYTDQQTGDNSGSLTVEIFCA